MEITFWEKMNQHLSNTYYLELIVIICSLLTTIIGIKFYRKERSLAILITYSLSCFLLFTGASLFTVLYRYKASPPSLTKAIILQTLNILFALMELFIFYYYYLKIFDSKITKTVMKVNLILFFMIIIFSLLKINDQSFRFFDINQFSALVATIEFLLLLFPVFI